MYLNKSVYSFVNYKVDLHLVNYFWQFFVDKQKKCLHVMIVQTNGVPVAIRANLSSDL